MVSIRKPIGPEKLDFSGRMIVNFSFGIKNLTNRSAKFSTKYFVAFLLIFSMVLEYFIESNFSKICLTLYKVSK